MKEKVVTGIFLVIISLMFVYAWTCWGYERNDYTVNHTNQFRAQNQFLINDFTRLQREGERQQFIDDQRRMKFERIGIEEMIRRGCIPLHRMRD